MKSWAAELSDRLLNVIRLIKKLAGGYKASRRSTELAPAMSGQLRVVEGS